MFKFLQHPRAAVAAAVVVPLLLGLMSVLAGQDDGWDMRNYHLYNPYALLHGRLGFDLAPAGFQSYFNPTLDLPYHFLNQWLPPRVAGFAMGVLHGLNFVLLLAIVRLLVPGGPRLQVLLALACVCAPGFLSELGNVMGDNLSALPALLSVWLALRHWDTLQQWGTRAAWAALAAGAAMGLSAGLKLTNATYAVALCAALLVVPLPWWQRLRLSFVAGVGVLAGMAATAGWWMLKMWQLFGNPVFPQFNNFFHSALAPETGVIDVAFRPLNWMENLLWPFLFTLNPRRVSEVPLKLAVWPVLYVTLAALLASWLLRRRAAASLSPSTAMAPRSVFLLAFVSVAYLVWMRMFSIYRYLVPIELLAPLAIWIAWRHVAPSAQRLAGVVLAVLALSAFPPANWGHADWADQAFSAEVPAFEHPGGSIVFFAQPDPPSGWMATFFPPQVRIIALGTGLYETPAWRARQQAAIAERPGPYYVLLSKAKNDRDATRLHKLAAAQWLGLTDDAAGCGKLESLMRHVRLQVALRRLPAGGCTFDLLPEHRIDLDALDRATAAQAAAKLSQYGLAADALDRATAAQSAAKLSQYGLQMDPASCTSHQAAVGAQPRPYALCRVTRAR